MSQTTKPALAVVTEEPGLLDQIVSRMTEVVQRSAPPVQPMELRSFDELERWADRAARSTMVPKAYQGKPDDIILAVQFGSEVGLRPMQAVQNIAVIGNRPAIWGDAMLALCMTHPLYRGVKETIEGEGDARTAICVASRQGDPPKEARFSVADAKKAGLWGKGGPWTAYPDRMLAMRARGFALRDAFPDKLRGLISAEEAGDYTLESAGISAAPPVVTEPPPTEDKARAGAEALAARFAAVATAQDYYAILDEPQTANRMQWLQKNRPELFTIVDTARATAATVMRDVPAGGRVAPPDEDDGWPAPATAGPAK